uniref:Flavodoxin-like fold domain-containing protein n=1 Tax=Oncorhynchus mykiss TaxID=8022 RepID=A0A8C7QQL8_ONCMY
VAAEKILIVYAHQSAGSFNAAAKDAAVKVLTSQGCKVEVSDLCHEVQREVKDAEHFQNGEETMLKWKEGRLSADITEEHRKPYDAVVVIFQVSSPAVLLNGWMDRVLTLGFAYTSEIIHLVVFLQEKKAMLSFTTGSHESISANGDHCRYNGNLHYCGFQVWAPQIFWAPNHIPSEARWSHASCLNVEPDMTTVHWCDCFH